jgi:hypothetical protein
MVKEGNYRQYQLAPYAGIDIWGIPTPAITSDGRIEIFGIDPTVSVGSGSSIWGNSGSLITSLLDRADSWSHLAQILLAQIYRDPSSWRVLILWLITKIP